MLYQKQTYKYAFDHEDLTMKSIIKGLKKGLNRHNITTHVVPRAKMIFPGFFTCDLIYLPCAMLPCFLFDRGTVTFVSGARAFASHVNVSTQPYLI